MFISNNIQYFLAVLFLRQEKKIGILTLSSDNNINFSHIAPNRLAFNNQIVVFR